MKIQCPVCQTTYNIRAEQITKPIARAACKRCGNTLAIHKDTGKVETTAPSRKPTQKPSGNAIQPLTSIPPSLTVNVAGRTGGGYRAKILIFTLVISIAAAGYYWADNSGMGFFSMIGISESKVVKGPNKLKVCRLFVRQDKKLQATIGKYDKLTLLNDELLKRKGKKISRVTVRVHGSKGKKRLQLMLVKEEGQWQVISMNEYRKVAKTSSRFDSKKKTSTKAPPTRPSRHAYKIRLYETYTNEQLADWVRANPNVEHLEIKSCGNITDVSSLTSLSRLSVLSLDGCSKIEDISPLTNLKSLKQLNLHRCKSILDLSPLTRLVSLRVLHLPPATTDEKLARVLSHLPQLETVSLKGCRQITDISPVAGLTSLTHLEMNYAPELVDITPLAGLTRLKVLDLKNSGIQDLKALSKLSDLEKLYIQGSKRLNDISPLKNLTNLKTLFLSHCKGISDITVLGNLTNLRLLSLRGLEDISDISALSSLDQLRRLYLEGCKKISPTQIDELQKSLPWCLILIRDDSTGRAV